MQPVAQGLLIDQDDQFDDPFAGLTARHGVDHGFDLQLVPGQVAVAGLAAELAAGSVDPGPQLGVTDRVEEIRVWRIPDSRSVQRLTFDNFRCLSNSSASDVPAATELR